MFASFKFAPNFYDMHFEYALHNYIQYSHYSVYIANTYLIDTYMSMRLKFTADHKWKTSVLKLKTVFKQLAQQLVG